MAEIHRPKIVRDGLILNLDAADINSYPGSGTVWNDVSGNGFNGTLTNGPTFSNNVLVFDGINDYVETPTSIGAELAGNLTYCIWAKRDGNSASSINGLISNEWHPEYTGIGIYLRNNDTQITVETGNGTSRPSYSLVHPTTNQNWTHYCLTYNSSIVTVYINGTLLDSRTAPVTQNPARQMVIGRWAPSYNSYYLNGRISNAQTYNRALTAQEVLQNYNATKTRFGL